MDIEQERKLMYENEIQDIKSVINNLINFRRKTTDLNIEILKSEKALNGLRIEIESAKEELEKLKSFIITKEENKIREEYLDKKEKSIQEFHKQAFDMFDKAEMLNKEVDEKIKKLEEDKKEFNFESSSIYLYTKKIQEEINKGNKIDVVTFIKNL